MDTRMQAPQGSARNTLLPDLCSGYYNLLVVVVSAELLAIALALSAPGSVHDWLLRLAFYTLYVQWIVLPCCVLLCLARRYFARLSDPQAALSAWFAIQGVTLCVGTVAWTLQTYLDVIPLLHGDALLRAQLISAILSAMLLRYLYVQHLWRLRVHSESEARAAALQSRIRPHFLFNAMNTISDVVHIHPAKAEELIGRLCTLFRASLLDTDSLGTLEEELELCHSYLQLEQERLGSRLRLEWCVDELPGTMPMPRLTLQPLLENAVYHGIEQMEDGGTVRLDGSCAQGRVHIHIVNPLPEKTPVGRRSSHHVALENVRLRLEYHHGDAAGFTTRTEGDQFHVELSLPVKK